MEKGKLKTEIEKNANELVNIVDECFELESRLKELKNKATNLKREILPEILINEGFGIDSKIVLQNGRVLILKEFFEASIPSLSKISLERNVEKANDLEIKRQDAFEWLENNNLSNIIKNFVKIQFNKDDNKRVEELTKYLSDNCIEFELDRNVHHQTLKASLKEHISNGKSVPIDTFSIVTGQIVDVK